MSRSFGRQRCSSSSFSMLGGPSAGLTASITVSACATAEALAAIAAVIDAVVFGLTSSTRTDSEFTAVPAHSRSGGSGPVPARRVVVTFPAQPADHTELAAVASGRPHGDEDRPDDQQHGQH